MPLKLYKKNSFKMHTLKYVAGMIECWDLFKIIQQKERKANERKRREKRKTERRSKHGKVLTMLNPGDGVYEAFLFSFCRSLKLSISKSFQQRTKTVPGTWCYARISVLS